MLNQEFTTKQKIVLIVSFLFLATSIGIQAKQYYENQSTYTINYESVNIKNMTQPHVATKVSNKKPVTDIITSIQETFSNVEEAMMGSPKEIEDFPATEVSVDNRESTRIWYLPTENGSVTTYPNYGHVAYDISSWRGTAETVYPIADGTISGLYFDPDGARVVTVLHVVNGIKYTSQYVHLSSYANGLYVGKQVTAFDPIGQMGSTGQSTGVHLHIAVLDCALFDPSDANCYDLNAWYRYDKQRLSEDFYGLGVLTYVPDSWNSRT